MPKDAQPRGGQFMDMRQAIDAIRKYEQEKKEKAKDNRLHPNTSEGVRNSKLIQEIIDEWSKDISE